MTATESAAGPDLAGFHVPELFGNITGHDELDKVSDYYKQSDGWPNRLIQGDSLLAMNSLLAARGHGRARCSASISTRPTASSTARTGRSASTTAPSPTARTMPSRGEPEQIKAFRDTWELGIHSYLSYLRDRLLVARELLHDSGSCFVQISDENVHLVRCLMDEVFGSGNFVA